MKIVLELFGKTQTEGQCRGQSSLTISFSIGDVVDEFLSHLRNRLNGNLISIELSNLDHFLNSFCPQIGHKQLISEIFNGYLDVRVKINHRDEGFWPIFLDPLDVFWYTDLDDFFTCDVLEGFLLLLALLRLLPTIFLGLVELHLLLSVDFALENVRDILDTLAHFVKALNALEVLDNLIFSNDGWDSVEILLPQRSDGIILVDFLVLWGIGTFHTPTHVNAQNHRLEALFLSFLHFLADEVFLFHLIDIVLRLSAAKDALVEREQRIAF